MKKLFLSFTLLVGLVTLSNAKTYECYRYVNGKPTGTWIKVKASSKNEAYTKAMEKFKKLGGRVDSTNCHYVSG